LSDIERLLQSKKLKKRKNTLEKIRKEAYIRILENAQKEANALEEQIQALKK